MHYVIFLILVNAAVVLAEPISLGAAGLIAGGSLLASGASSAFNAWQASKNRKFQERMSSTAHQRQVKDLRRAGLNPVLSASGGQGAATPGGATATASTPPNFASAVQAYQSLSAVKANEATANSANASSILNLQKAITENQLRFASLNKLQNEARLLSKKGALTDEERHVQFQIRMQIRKRLKLMDINLKLLQNQMPQSSAYANYYRGIGKYEPYATGGSKFMQPVTSALGAFLGARTGLPGLRLKRPKMDRSNFKYGQWYRPGDR